MNKVKPTRKSKAAAKPAAPVYNSPIRAEQARQTRERIEAAAAELLKESGGETAITFKAVAARAGLTEMTVYRHFPTREALLQGLWRHLNQQMAPGIGMPASREELLGQHLALFKGFDELAPQIIASVTTAQGREMRAALNTDRRKAFRQLVTEQAPTLSRAEQTRAAAIIQLLHSAHAWLSLREQWEMSGSEAAAATRWAIDTLLDHLKRQRP